MLRAGTAPVGAVEKKESAPLCVGLWGGVHVRWGKIPHHKPHLQGPKRPLGIATPSPGKGEGTGRVRHGGFKLISAPPAPGGMFSKGAALLGRMLFY